MECCPGNRFALIRCHGVMLGSEFKLTPSSQGIPRNIITFTELGQTLSFDYKIDAEVSYFYSQGKYLFCKKDKSYRKTEDGHRFEKYLQMRIPYITINNHVYREKQKNRMNNMMLDFVQAPCNKHSCSIDCDRILYAPYTSKKQCIPDLPEKSIKLSQLVRLEKDVDSFIIIACRSYAPHIGSQLEQIMREISLQHSTLRQRSGSGSGSDHDPKKPTKK